MEEELAVHNIELPELCEAVLRENDHGKHTVPSPSVYAHQWLWDSAFSAIGWAHLDTKRAEQEIYSLLKGQWHNGMVPHMIFDMSPQFAGDRNMWRSVVSRKSPENIATSGITQPPVIAEAVWRIGQKQKKAERIIFYKKVLPKLVKYHEWLYNERDPHQEGLVLQIHPYETGLDNTPPWMNQLHEHSKPWWITAVDKVLPLNWAVNIIRRDTRNLPPEQRMANVDALLSWDILRRLRRKHYDIDRILHRSIFIIEDVSFNAMFIRNNSLLKEIASEARIKLPKSLLDRMAQSETALEDMWDEQYGLYFSRDFSSHKLLREPTIASILPLYAGTISPEKAKRLVQVLLNPYAFGLKYPVPSVPKNVRGFNSKRYWQGPVWVNMNWLLIDGLKRYGYEKEASHLKEKTLQLLEQNGVWEYYNPLTGEGLGSADFSWTAALAFDLLKTD
jgi:neutral trehalase